MSFVRSIEEMLAIRTDMINGMFVLGSSDEEKQQILDFMVKVRTILSNAAKEINGAKPAKFNTGRMIAGMDTFQAAKNIFCDSVILPWGELPQKE